MTNTKSHNLSGRLDASNAKTHETQIMEMLGADVTALEIDLSQLDYISSAGLRVFLVVAKHTQAKGISLTLRSANPNVMKILRMSNFDKILTLT